MPKQNDYVTKDHFDKVIQEKFDKVMERLDEFMGKHKAHDEEHILLTNRISEHTDNLELINARLGIQL